MELTYTYDKGRNRWKVLSPLTWGQGLASLANPLSAVASGLGEHGCGSKSLGRALTFAGSNQNIIRLNTVAESLGITVRPDTIASQRLEELRQQFRTHLEEVRAFKNVKSHIDKVGYRAFVENELHIHTPLPLFNHQLEMLVGMIYLPWAGIFADCGLGKTAVALVAMQFLLQHGFVDRCIVIGPLSILETAWIDDGRKFTPELSMVNLWEKPGKKKQAKMQEKLASAPPVLVMNYETAHRLIDDLLAYCRTYRTMVVIDEATRLRGIGQEARAIRQLSQVATRRYPMTATPIPNQPINFWGVWNFADQGCLLDDNYYDFQSTYMYPIPIGQVATKWEPRSGWVGRLVPRIASRQFVYRLRDCVDLPELIEKIHYVDLEPATRTIYDQMEEDAYVELGQDESVSVNVQIAVLGKLRQITGGFLLSKDEDGNAAETSWRSSEKHDALLHYLEKILEGEGNKVIVWCEFRAEIDRCVAMARTLNAGVVELHGRVPQSQRDSNIRSFQQDPATRVIVVHPQAGGLGITLTAANYAIYYSYGFNYELRYQSLKRYERTGQKRTMYTVYLAARNTIDQDILKTLAKKENNERRFLQSIRQERIMRTKEA